jgi:hypothetical protein
MATKPRGLIGHYFHSIDKETGHLEWQGQVIANPEPGWYLLQLFEWLMGEPNVQRLVRIEDMADWLFYENGEEMEHSYSGGAGYRHLSPIAKDAVDRELAKK